MSDMKNLMITMALSLAVMTGWYWWYGKPHMEAAEQAARARQAAALMEQQNQQQSAATTLPVDQAKPVLNREDALQESNARIRINSPRLHGSLALKGARFDDITLAKYRETVKKDSPEVVLLSPSRTPQSYFAEFGWLAPKGDAIVPDANTLWQASAPTLTPEQPVTLSWENGQGLRFLLHLSLDKHFMFSVRQEVENSGGQPVTLMPYGIINRTWRQEHMEYLILHEGPLGVMGGSLHEETYADLEKDKRQEYKDNTAGWLGITDKYWLTAIVPAQDKKFTGNFSYSDKSGQPKFQVDYLGEELTVAAGKKEGRDLYFFAGAKEISVLDHYADSLKIPLFDRAVDLGYLYFLTKPIFLALNFFFSVTGNFGLAILILTIILKTALFPMANKSYVSMSQMKRLQPDIMRLRELHKSDKMRLNKEVMELYKREKVNPMAGCLPILIQIPVFFALYKVLFVTIEMRHAPFFGWIHDLSAPDPTTLFNLFGLIPFTPPDFLMIGIWPLVMGITMYLQQLLQPPSADPVQAKVMKMLPFIFIFLFSTFPAGLIIYWAWSNTLSIIQQWVIQERVMKQEKKHAKGK